MSDAIRIEIPDNAPVRLDKALFDCLPEGTGISRTKMTALIKAGAVVRDTGEVVAGPKVKPQMGDVFVLTLPKPEPSLLIGENIPLVILHEDEHLIVIDKPIGLVMHPAPGSPSGTLVNALIHHVGDGLLAVGASGRPGIVHRIDKDTSGIVVVAKTDLAHLKLAAQFADHSIEREYLAITKGVPDRADPRLAGLRGVGFEEGGWLRIATQFGRHPGDRKRMAVLAEGGRHAITRFQIEERLNQAFGLIRCRLETGRTHQIRVHLSYLGHGLVGDQSYGTRRMISRDFPEARGFGRQALHAARLGFLHPATRAFLRFESQPPDDFTGLCETLRNKV
ncbi:MAG: RluA family pseudouridine synthase [Pseudomonadota bacterium]